MNVKGFITEIIECLMNVAKSDERLSDLLKKAQEYAQMYLFAKQRQKGCDGMGEMVNLQNEFKEVLAELVAYCNWKKYLTNDIAYDIDLVADEITKRNTFS